MRAILSDRPHPTRRHALCLHEALGDKAGLARMGCALGAAGGAVVRAVLDLSNRPHFASDLPLDEEYVGGVREWDDEAAGRAEAAAAAAGGGRRRRGEAAAPAPCDVCGGVLSCEMLHHAFDSLTIEVRATLHLELQSDRGGDGHTTSRRARRRRGVRRRALALAIRVDPGGAAPSRLVGPVCVMTVSLFLLFASLSIVAPAG